MLISLAEAPKGITELLGLSYFKKHLNRFIFSAPDQVVPRSASVAPFISSSNVKSSWPFNFKRRRPRIHWRNLLHRTVRRWTSQGFWTLPCSLNPLPLFALWNQSAGRSRVTVETTRCSFFYSHQHFQNSSRTIWLSKQWFEKSAFFSPSFSIWNAICFFVFFIYIVYQ